MITLLVVAGIAILIAIGYMNHVVENNKLEKARTKVELNDRLRRCGELTETFPGQFMTPALKLLLTRLELNVCQRLLNLEKTSAATKARITELNTLVAQGESIPVNNPPAPILTEAKAKDVRFLLEALHGHCCTSSSSTTSANSPCNKTNPAKPASRSNAACNTCANNKNRRCMPNNWSTWRNCWLAPTPRSWTKSLRWKVKRTN